MTSLEDILAPYFVANIAIQLVLSLTLGIVILTGKTVFPRWFVLLTPIVTMWFVYPAALLPQPVNIIMAGGWYNIIGIIFFISAAILLKKPVHMNLCPD